VRLIPPISLAQPLAAGSFVVLLAFAAGCGSDSGRGSVKGKITVSGKPLAKGTITFLPTTGTKDPITTPVTNGEYTIPDLPVGLAKVYIIPPLTSEPSPVDKGDGVPAARPERKKVVVPEKYQNPTTSGLSLTVQKGENKFDADLTP
jgi:hypothetical protein